MPTIVLLGDSSFNNVKHAPQGASILELLRARLPEGVKAVSRALDGNAILDVYAQANKLPSEASHLFVSVGMVDAMKHESIFFKKNINAIAVFEQLYTIREGFRDKYEAMVRNLLNLRLPLAVSTLFSPNPPHEHMRRALSAGMAVFNDAILDSARAYGLPALDMHSLVRAPGDYADPLHPSAAAGARIAERIAAIAAGHDFAARRTVLYAAQPQEPPAGKKS
ncbi:MAG: GDSL-type esterase/lipase family protein [Thermodesulfobacteriota bacterium]